jgi:hypothetical protein
MKCFIKHTLFSDSGHSWLKVSRKRLDTLGILPNISSFSYVLGDNIYLEEDCDITLYFKALANYFNLTEEEVTSGFRDKLDSKYSDRSKVRTYNHYEFLNPSESAFVDSVRSELLDKIDWSKKGLKSIMNGTLEDFKYWNEYYSLNVELEIV